MAHNAWRIPRATSAAGRLRSNAETGQMGTGTNLSGFATYEESARDARTYDNQSIFRSQDFLGTSQQDLGVLPAEATAL